MNSDSPERIQPGSALQTVLDRLESVSRTSSGYQARCPAHDDHNPSLSISEGEKGVVVHCHAGCTQEEVVSALGLKMEDLFFQDTTEKWSPWEGAEKAVYTYKDPDGIPLYQVVRYEMDDRSHAAYGDKKFLQRAYLPDHEDAGKQGCPEGYVWGRAKHDVKPVLYRLPEVIDAVQRGDTVFLVEGEKDVETLREVGLTATCIPGGASAGDPGSAVPDGILQPLAGADVVCIPDNDGPGRSLMDHVAKQLLELGAAVRIAELPGLPQKGDVTDFLCGQGHTLEDLERIVEDTDPVEEASIEAAETEADSAGHGGSKPQVERLLGLVESVHLFHTPKGEAYASFEENGTLETARISSSIVGDMLRRRFYKKEGRPPSSQALQDARDALRAMARFDGPEEEVHLRVAGYKGDIYIDLCDTRRHVVHITPDGWAVVSASTVPVRFRRPSGMAPLPVPESGGDLALLKQHVTVREEDFPLLLGCLVAYASPRGPYPVANLLGEQGSGKTSTTRNLRSLLDPSRVPIRSGPRTERDLVVAAENSWVLAFDNLSGIPPWLSDAFCRLSTGGGFGTRSLYADREEELFYSLRPLILNGIDEVATRGDLVDRTITFELPPIDSEERRTEAQLRKAFEEDRPFILGALYDALSAALRREEEVELNALPRMADFAKWVTAAEEALPFEEGTFMARYTGKRARAREEAVESDLVASAIVDLLRSREEGTWRGTMSELLVELQEEASESSVSHREFPDTYQALTNKLKRVMPALREVGVVKEELPRTANRREFELRLERDSRDKTASRASSASKEGQSAGK